ncbi:hypothetical protein [Actinoplanes couchii]|uniref:Uncharacterized protein n=1 Tax=Actinoplanes couchii TaxID=403638 RepID=A0ABQ3X597_9ACTN|nr:hypothetical protein [Actinoplanes couchii]MDR6325950.1 hypothetical protein [Actinoplanes couchii]GID53698.1 hypothetical protein Aco03nite_021020 [Actinoplanes couchii]
MKTTFWLPVALGLLAAPRAVLHDLELIEPETGLNAALVFVPLIVWILIAVRAGADSFRLPLKAGLVYGICLAVIHNLLWDGAARLSGTLAGRFSAPVEELLLRTTMSISSLLTGLLAGAACGAVAWLLTSRKRPTEKQPSTR